MSKERGMVRLGDKMPGGGNSRDQRISCVDCKKDFVFTQGEQSYFAERQLSPPKRCKPCRDTKRNKNGAGGKQK